MHNAFCIQRQVDLDQLGEYFFQYILTEREGLAVGQIEQRYAAAQLLHHNHEAGALLEKVMDLDDPRGVTQAQQTLDLERQVV